MNQNLAKRVDAAMICPPLCYLITSDLASFQKAVESARTFSELPRQYQMMIEKAEAFQKAHPSYTGRNDSNRFTWTPEEFKQGLEEGAKEKLLHPEWFPKSS